MNVNGRTKPRTGKDQTVKKRRTKKREQQEHLLTYQKCHRLVEEMKKGDLQRRVEICARLVRDKLRRGGDTALFLAFAFKGNEGLMLPAGSFSTGQGNTLKAQAIQMAEIIEADCLVVAFTAWTAPDCRSRPSEHPDRTEAIAVTGKDHFAHVAAIQDVFRKGSTVSFGDLEFCTEVQSSWMNAYSGFDRVAAMRLRRRSIGIDNSREYLNIAESRFDGTEIGKEHEKE